MSPWWKAATSFASPAFRSENRHWRYRAARAAQRPPDQVEHGVKFFPHVFRRKAEDQIPVLLQQQILPAIATVCDRIREVLRTVQLDGHSCIGVQQATCSVPAPSKAMGNAALS